MNHPSTTQTAVNPPLRRPTGSLPWWGHLTVAVLIVGGIAVSIAVGKPVVAVLGGLAGLSTEAAIRRARREPATAAALAVAAALLTGAELGLALVNLAALGMIH